jgi:hypothetical protein
MVLFWRIYGPSGSVKSNRANDVVDGRSAEPSPSGRKDLPFSADASRAMDEMENGKWKMANGKCFQGLSSGSDKACPPGGRAYPAQPFIGLLKAVF